MWLEQSSIMLNTEYWWKMNSNAGKCKTQLDYNSIVKTKWWRNVETKNIDEVQCKESRGLMWFVSSSIESKKSEPIWVRCTTMLCVCVCSLNRGRSKMVDVWTMHFVIATQTDHTLNSHTHTHTHIKATNIWRVQYSMPNRIGVAVPVPCINIWCDDLVVTTCDSSYRQYTSFRDMSALRKT